VLTKGIRALIVIPLTMISLGSFTNAEAGLIPQGVLDQPNHLLLTFGWNPETPDALTPALQFWNVTVRVEVNPALISVNATVQHAINPHANETIPNITSLGVSVPVGGVQQDTSTIMVNHPGPLNHQDTYTIFFRHAALPANNFIELSGTHPPPDVPEPSTQILVGCCLAGLIARKFPRDFLNSSRRL